MSRYCVGQKLNVVVESIDKNGKAKFRINEGWNPVADLEGTLPKLKEMLENKEFLHSDNYSHLVSTVQNLTAEVKYLYQDYLNNMENDFKPDAEMVNNMEREYSRDYEA